MILTSIFFICCYLSIAFTLSSFDKVEDPDCDLETIERQIAINFVNPNDANWARETNYQGWIPGEDLRSGTSPGLMLMVRDKWFCKITVTSPQCSDYIFETVLLTGSSVANLTIPSESDFYIEVIYYETFDAPHAPFNFNIPAAGGGSGSDAGRLLWVHDEYYMSAWNNGVTQPVYVQPSVLIEDKDPWGGADPKGGMFADFENANDFIENRGTNN
ncbi:MAG: hypothetical protein L3J09_11110 [Flavobacteriaceae bacterium]|nr:hypothetical protein [Flavobacteriaceae bacterium]